MDNSEKIIFLPSKTPIGKWCLAISKSPLYKSLIRKANSWKRLFRWEILFGLPRTGTHQFPAMQRLSIQKGHAFMLVYSITSKQTFEELKPIYNQIREIKAEQQNETPILLMGCKLDEAACREVTENLGKQLATQWSCAWIETSAKNNTNIREAFQELLKLDRKRQFNFNVDQDGHLLDETNGPPTPSSPSPHGGKRSTPNSNSSTTTNSGSSPNMTETNVSGPVLTRPTTPVLQGSKNSRTSIMSTSSSSTSNVKKGSRTTIDQSDHAVNTSGSKKASDASSARTSTRKCLIMWKRQGFSHSMLSFFPFVSFVDVYLFFYDGCEHPTPNLPHWKQQLISVFLFFVFSKKKKIRLLHRSSISLAIPFNCSSHWFDDHGFSLGERVDRIKWRERWASETSVSYESAFRSSSRSCSRWSVFILHRPAREDVRPYRLVLTIDFVHWILLSLPRTQSVL